jgi:hypothetical protein
MSSTVDGNTCPQDHRRDDTGYRCRVTDIWTYQPARGLPASHYARRVTPLQKVAMGLVIVVVSARFAGYDALPDPVGWALALAVTAGVVAVPLWLPAVADRVAPSGQWAASLPQSLFCIVLCTGLAQVADRAGDGTGHREAVRFGLLRWAFVVVAAGPVLVYGGGVTALAAPLAVLAVLANLALVYYLFKVSRRGYGSTTLATPSSAGG